MKKFMLSVAAVALTSSAEAVVILNDAILRPAIFPPDHLELILFESKKSGGLFMIDIETVSASQFKFTLLGIAEVYSIFDVGAGVELTSEFVIGNAPLLSNSSIPLTSGTVNFNMNEIRYFGYWDNRLSAGLPGADSGDNYGWMQLTLTSSGLVLSSSATAVGGGIIVGTVTQIPEPSVLISGAAGLALMSGRRRR